MRINRINCISAGCNICAKAVRVGESFFGEDLYRCSPYKKKHKKIDGKDCGEFRCNACGSCGLLCDDCRRGE